MQLILKIDVNRFPELLTVIERLWRKKKTKKRTVSRPPP